MAASAIPECVYLVGFMGSGKSAVGRALADRLGYRFVDTDTLVEETESRSIERIFAESGEPRFREREREVLRALANEKHIVVATGGGLFQGESERKIIESHGVSVWLDTPLETIWERCRSTGGRPLFGDLPELQALFDQRRAGYALADQHVRAGSRPVPEVVDEIHRWLAGEGHGGTPELRPNG
jgi:shikimate kinase